MQNRGALLAVYLLFLTCLGQPVFADITTFALDFSSTTGLVFNQNAAPSVDNLKLVDENSPGEIGSVWFSTLQSLAGGFYTTFQFSICGEGRGLWNGGEMLTLLIYTT